MHSADAFIQTHLNWSVAFIERRVMHETRSPSGTKQWNNSAMQWKTHCIQVMHIIGNRTHDLGVASTM